MLPYTCWTDGFTYEKCCDSKLGPRGDLGCWDSFVTYESCCLDHQSSIADAFSCWTPTLPQAACCPSQLGPRGNSDCWDDFYTYEACCIGEELGWPVEAKIPRPLTATHLQLLEATFGGFRTGVASASGRLERGGDRMSSTLHNYAPCYARLVNRMLHHWAGKVMIIAEIGILLGSGLAMWSTIFPNAQIIGLDIDTSNTLNNLPFLKSRGAFNKSDAELITFDQNQRIAHNQQLLAKALHGRKLKMVIDDGLHTNTSIQDTFLTFVPFLDEDSLYVVEDLCYVAQRFCWRKAQHLLAALATINGFELIRCIESKMYALVRTSNHSISTKLDLGAVQQAADEMDSSLYSVLGVRLFQ